MDTRRVALVYDRVNKWGGAERLLLVLNEMFPEAPLYTSVYDEKEAAWAKAFPEVVTSFLQKIPLARRRHDLFSLAMPLAFEAFDFGGFDTVISVSSEFAKGIVTRPATLHVNICLTPTRYLWSGYREYFRNRLTRTLSLPAVGYLRFYDHFAAQRADALISISKNVGKRVKKYYGRDSTVIYPPLTLKNKALKRDTKLPVKDFYLVVTRLVPYKKCGLVVETFNRLGKKLVIVGEGSEEKRLKFLARKNVFFAGKLTDESLVNYYKGARGLIFPQEEDFGLVPVEAQSLGLPVIAFKAGGALETVVEGVSGVFFKTQSQESLAKAIEAFEKMSFKKEAVVRNAEKFSKAKFKKEILKLIEDERKKRGV